MEKKLQLVSLAATGRFTFTQLGAEFHVSRKTGHKWRERYRREGAAGLGKRSRRPDAQIAGAPAQAPPARPNRDYVCR